MAKTVLGVIFVIIIVLIRENKEDRKINVLTFELEMLDMYEKNKLNVE